MIKHIDKLLQSVFFKVDRSKKDNKKVSEIDPYWFDMKAWVEDDLKNELRELSMSINNITYYTFYVGDENRVNGYKMKNELVRLITIAMIMYDRIEEKHHQENEKYLNIYPTEHPLHLSNKKED